MATTTRAMRKRCASEQPAVEEATRFAEVDSHPPAVECCVCKDVFDGPVDLPCRHVICRGCASGCNSRCPLCRAPFVHAELKPTNFVLVELINNLRVECTRCHQVLTRQNAATHDNYCPLRNRPCKFAEFGCKVAEHGPAVEAHEHLCPCGTIEHISAVARDALKRAGELVGTTGFGTLWYCIDCPWAAPCDSWVHSDPNIHCPQHGARAARFRRIILQHSDLLALKTQLGQADPCTVKIAVCDKCYMASFSFDSVAFDSRFTPAPVAPVPVVFEPDISEFTAPRGSWQRYVSIAPYYHAQTGCWSHVSVRTISITTAATKYLSFAPGPDSHIKRALFLSSS